MLFYSRGTELSRCGWKPLSGEAWHPVPSSLKVRAGPPLLNAPLQSRNDPQEAFLADLQDMFFVWHNDRLYAM